MSARFHIAHIGPLVSIQDGGRHGYMRYGVTGAGAMDRLSHALGNLALGNNPEQASIEVSLGGLTLTCTEGSTTLAITGGHFDIRLNGKSMPPWCRFNIQEGSQLSIRPGSWGSWCYVAFTDTIVSESWLGSQSMIMNTHLCGSGLQTNDSFYVEKQQQQQCHNKQNG